MDRISHYIFGATVLCFLVAGAGMKMHYNSKIHDLYHENNRLLENTLSINNQIIESHRAVMDMNEGFFETTKALNEGDYESQKKALEKYFNSLENYILSAERVNDLLNQNIKYNNK